MCTCEVPGCGNTFHPLCAAAAGFITTFKFLGKVRAHLVCHAHAGSVLCVCACGGRDAVPCSVRVHV
jgi:hypothetical protein